MWKQWVIDATMGCADGLFAFCPIEGDLEGEYAIITGVNLLSDVPPEHGQVVAIVHADGQEAVEAFCEKYADELEKLKEELHGNHR